MSKRAVSNPLTSEEIVIARQNGVAILYVNEKNKLQIKGVYDMEFPIFDSDVIYMDSFGVYEDYKEGTIEINIIYGDSRQSLWKLSASCDYKTEDLYDNYKDGVFVEDYASTNMISINLN